MIWNFLSSVNWTFCYKLTVCSVTCECECGTRYRQHCRNGVNSPRWQKKYFHLEMKWSFKFDPGDSLGVIYNKIHQQWEDKRNGLCLICWTPEGNWVITNISNVTVLKIGPIIRWLGMFTVCHCVVVQVPMGTPETLRLIWGLWGPLVTVEDVWHWGNI